MSILRYQGHSVIGFRHTVTLIGTLLSYLRYLASLLIYFLDGIGSIISFLVDKSTIRAGWIIPFFSWKVWLRRSLALINSIFSFGTGDKSRCTTVFDFSVLVDFDLILLL